MNKQLLKKRFSNNLNNYNKHAYIQLKMANDLFNYLDKSKYNNILEIGCGTGFLTQIIQNKISYKQYTAIDIVKECEIYIKQISNDINFINEDIESYYLKNNSKYDLIISNATFQWFDDIEDFINKNIQKLSKNGVLIFSTFGKENFKEIYKTTGISLNYKNIDFYKKILSPYKYLFEENKYQIQFNTAIDVLKHIKNTGVNAICETHWTKSQLLNFENLYNQICPNKKYLTYNPIYIKINI